jgi:Asp-tRNA(Asn)/Glu-tRNA(Gln) amidotransferase A subunit family amidase
MSLAAALVVLVLQESSEAGAPGERDAFTADDVRAAGRVLGESFTDAEIELMLEDLRETRAGLERLRADALPNDLAPALLFRPDLRASESAVAPVEPAPASYACPRPSSPPARPADLEELAFASLPALAQLVHGRAVSCEELARLFLTRLERYDPALHFLVTATEERALEQARALDAELALGRCRGRLHGIPWVAKDLLAVRGYPTTWGAEPFAFQGFGENATVVERLDRAGAVLVGKVALGALAWGDVWARGTTRNPWNPAQGSSGSSAGSASAVAAGCAPFALGSETLGSIVSPSDRCGCSSLRPSFGRVSRAGAMTLCWSLDKLGPIARSATDAGIVLAAIHGADPRDPTAVTRPFDPLLSAAPDVHGWKVGYVPETEREDPQFQDTLDELTALGVELVPLELPRYPVGEMLIVLAAEAGTAFDDFSRGMQDDELRRQTRDAWPNVFRAARLVPATDYLRANRLRTELARDWDRLLADVVALVHPSFAGSVLAATNLTGHPTFVAPAGFREDGTPWSVSFTGRLFGETELLALARAWQAATDHEDRHPRVDPTPTEAWLAAEEESEGTPEDAPQDD